MSIHLLHLGYNNINGVIYVIIRIKVMDHPEKHLPVHSYIHLSNTDIKLALALHGCIPPTLSTRTIFPSIQRS